MNRKIVNLKTMNILSDVIIQNLNQVNICFNSREKLKEIFKNKDVLLLIEEFEIFINNLSKDYNKKKPRFTAIFILTLLIYRIKDEQNIFIGVKNHNLGRLLYGGISALLSGKCNDFSLNIEFNTSKYSNKYEFISKIRLSQFCKINTEIMEIVKYIYVNYNLDFKRLALNDKSKFILLNMCNNIFSIKVSMDFINSLLGSSDELNRNIGFYLITAKLKFSMEKKEHIRHCKKIGIKKNGIGIVEINKIINEDLKLIENCLKMCDAKTKVSLVTNYLLSEKPSINLFYKLLLEPKSQKYVIEEIGKIDKFRRLEDVYYYLKTIHHKSEKMKKGYYNRQPLYDAIIELIIIIFRNNIAIYQWSDLEDEIFQKICSLLIKSSKEKMRIRLLKVKRNLMTKKIDELVRFDIYIEDKRKEEIANGMLKYLNY
ncbi:hypothetical protein [Clostridium sp.]|uniref:hypothetical protein n=1 Tax=Clostridium sp. TaxID=1506 RepID=UPI0028450901|nr:hypothetical protein [Clostridium sp.]MDR3594241.1 hypothetical protein [Clostridium sp.]